MVRACIHRGTKEIGGTCVEVESQDKRIVLDVGLPLDVGDATDVPLPEGSGEASGGGTARILIEPGELVYAACLGRYGLAGHYPHFDTACFRASRSVYEATPQPWFDFEYDANRTRLTLCECRWFLGRLPPGIEPKRAGRVGRLTEMVGMPGTDGGQRVCTPHEVLTNLL